MCFIRTIIPQIVDSIWITLVKKRHFIAKLILSALTLAFVYSQVDVDIMETAQTIKPVTWLLAGMAMVCQMALISWRWQLLINLKHYHINYFDALKISFASNLANIFFITSVGGVVVKIGLAAQFGIGFLRSLMATLIDRLFSVLTLLFLTAISVPVVYRLLPPDISSLMVVVTFACLTATFLFLFFISHKLKDMDFIRKNKRFATFLNYIRALLLKPARLNGLVGLSLVAQTSYFVAVYIILLSLGADVSFLQVFLVLPAIAFIASLPISIGGWGIREGAFVYGLSLFGVPMETAFIASIEVGLLSMVASLALGLPAFFTQDVLRFFSTDRVRVKHKQP